MLTGRTEKIKGELDQAAADMADAGHSRKSMTQN